MMKHRTEEELIAYRDGDAKDRVAIAEHLSGCADCREEMERIEAVYAAMSAMSVPEPGEEFERRLWQKIAPRLEEKSALVGRLFCTEAIGGPGSAGCDDAAGVLFGEEDEPSDS